MNARQLEERIKKAKAPSEAHIQATCTDWLELDGWRCVRTDLPHLRGLGVSELGMADSLYIRYYDPRVDRTEWLTGHGTLWQRAQAQVMWIEWKKKGGKAAQHQRDWHARERARGALTLIAGEDFAATITAFCHFYIHSGLQRKRISIPR